MVVACPAWEIPCLVGWEVVVWAVVVVGVAVGMEAGAGVAAAAAVAVVVDVAAAAVAAADAAVAIGLRVEWSTSIMGFGSEFGTGNNKSRHICTFSQKNLIRFEMRTSPREPRDKLRLTDVSFLFFLVQVTFEQCSSCPTLLTLVASLDIS